MLKRNKTLWKAPLIGAALFMVLQTGLAFAALPIPVGTIDPNTIPKYVTPLVIPPEMPKSTTQPGGPAAEYNIAVRQFQQQILPASYPSTTVWSYGRAEDAVPALAPSPGSSFNYPAFTVENTSGVLTTVRWINGLVDASGNYLPHLFAVDQTLHWANPPATGCTDGTNRTDCMTTNPDPYLGPVPLVTHVHGAHVNPESDGYPEAWWLPAAKNIPASYATNGDIYDQYNKSNNVPGSAYYGYENTQPATTLWYHDHALGMTRLNVYAGPAGFWVIRGGVNGDAYVTDNTGAPAVLPGPRPMTVDVADPNFDPAVRAAVREIPIVIQDRTFKTDGSLFYPDNRAYFEGLNQPAPIPPQFDPADTESTLDIPFIGDPTGAPSDIAAIWNPEAFFHTMVVNGSTWPELNVAPALYRFRLLNGCNSRFLNLSLVALDVNDNVLGEVPFYMLGAEQGFYPNVVRIVTGQAVQLTPGAAEPALPTTYPAPGEAAALAMGPAVRSDVIVDFGNLPTGTVKVRMLNAGPDSPFGGFPIDPADLADPATTGQIMEFLINQPALASDALTTAPRNLVLPFEGHLAGPIDNTRQVSLNEEVSSVMCWDIGLDGGLTLVPGSVPPECLGGGEPVGPKAALLGTVDIATGTSTPLRWMAPITENPIIGDTEVWEIFNLTMDAHPIHLHLVRFEVVNRQGLQMDPTTMEPIPVVDTTSPVVDPNPWEAGFRDMVTANPGEVTRIKARFDTAGLYVWHCHIVEHEDNEMMRPYTVRYDPQNPDLNQDGCVDRIDYSILVQVARSSTASWVSNLKYDLNEDGLVNISDARFLTTQFTNPRGTPCR